MENCHRNSWCFHWPWWFKPQFFGCSGSNSWNAPEPTFRTSPAMWPTFCRRATSCGGKAPTRKPSRCGKLVTKGGDLVKPKDLAASALENGHLTSRYILGWCTHERWWCCYSYLYVCPKGLPYWILKWFQPTTGNPGDSFFFPGMMWHQFNFATCFRVPCLLFWWKFFSAGHLKIPGGLLVVRCWNFPSIMWDSLPYTCISGRFLNTHCRSKNEIAGPGKTFPPTSPTKAETHDSCIPDDLAVHSRN